jgi:hypothetical protein
MASIDEAFGRGLRPHATLHRDNRYLREMLNQIPLGPRRSRPLALVTYPLGSPSLGMSFPNPMILKDEKILGRFDASTYHDIAPSTLTATSRNVHFFRNYLQNRRFITDTLWTKGAGWTITGGAAVAATASSDLEQVTANLAIPFSSADVYLVTFTVTRSAGSVTPKIGTAAGTTRSTSGTFTEEITANASNVSFILTGSGFTGTVDNISVVRRTTINSTTPWQMVGFQDRAWFACSGTNFLYWLPDNPVDLTGGPAVMIGSPSLTVGAVGKHDNAMVLGGMAGTQLARTLVADLFTYWKRVQRQRQITIYGETLDSSYIMYCNDSDFDSPFYLLMAALAIPGDDEATMLRGVLRRAIDKGWLGFYRPRFVGAVRAIKQLGAGLVVYGANGVARLTRSEAGYSEAHLLEQGIAGRGCMNGDDSEHLFLSGAGELYIDRGQGPRLLGAGEGDFLGGFAEYMANLTIANAVISFDTQNRRWWISDGSRCYCWTGYGLGESDQVQPSSVFRLSLGGTLYGTAVTKDDPQTARLVSTIISNGGNTFEVSSYDVTATESDASSWTATSDYRMRQSDQFRRPAAIDVPDRGRCYVKKTGLEQRCVLIAPNCKEVSVDSVGINVGQGAPALANIFAGADTVLNETNP